MKEKYTSPVVEITKFTVEDIITVSGTSNEDDTLIPTPVQADELFDYN